MRAKTKQAANYCRQTAEKEKKHRMQTNESALGHAQATHHRTGIKMTLHVAACGQCSGNRRKYYGQQRGEAQKSLGAIKGVANFRPGIARILKAFAALQAATQPGTKAGNSINLSRQQQAIGHPRTGLHQAAAGNIVEVHHQAWRQGEKIDAAIRLQGQNRRHWQGLFANTDLATRRNRNGARQALIEPDRTGLRPQVNRQTRRVLLGRRRELAAQGVATTDCLDISQLWLCPPHDHAREAQCFSDLQATSFCLQYQFG